MPAASSPVSHANVPSLAQTPANAFASPSGHSLSGSSGILVEHAAATTEAFDATHNMHRRGEDETFYCVDACEGLFSQAVSPLIEDSGI